MINRNEVIISNITSAMKNRVTLKRINRVIKKYDMQLLDGTGYFYFWPLSNTKYHPIHGLEETSVYVNSIQQLTLAQWEKEAKQMYDEAKKLRGSNG